MSRQYLIVGAGRFGTSIAYQLHSLGEEVMVIDRSEEKIHLLADKVSHAVQADAVDENALKALGVKNFDVAVVAIGSDIQSSILVTQFLKELGISKIIAKAQSEHHAKVLIKIGADHIVMPEMDMGVRVANSLMTSNYKDLMELTAEYSVAELPVKEKWINKTLRSLSIREKYNVSLMAIKRGSEMIIAIDPDTEILFGDEVMVIGLNDDLIKLGKI